jgi:hypothetical protein
LVVAPPPPPRPKYRQAYFDEAQAQQALWQEFQDHGASLNNTLNEALLIHAGPTWQIFKVRAFIIEFEIFSCRISRLCVL